MKFGLKLQSIPNSRLHNQTLVPIDHSQVQSIAGYPSKICRMAAIIIDAFSINQNLELNQHQQPIRFYLPENHQSFRASSIRKFPFKFQWFVPQLTVEVINLLILF